MKVAVLGVGRLGAAHAATIAALPQVSELRIYDADPVRAREIAAPLGAQVAGSAEVALRGIDAAVIVTPTPTHAPLIHHCLDAGIATFCEKPVAMEIAETEAVVAHVARVSGRLQIGFQRRFDAGYASARRTIAAGTLGAVYSFVMVSCDRLPPPDGYIATSGGQFKDQLIHDFDNARWLFDSEVTEVSATGSTFGLPQYTELGDVATSAVTLTLATGTVGVVIALRHNEAGYDIHAEIHGARETIAIGVDPRTPWRSVEADAPALAGPAYPSFFVRFADAYRAELAHFLRYAQGEADTACTAADALAALRIAEAAGRSWRERQPVALAAIG